MAGGLPWIGSLCPICRRLGGRGSCLIGASAHSRRARAALARLPDIDPAIAALALWCTHRDGDVTTTAGAVITYGPGFDTRPIHEQTGLAAHHILHVALRHTYRASEMAMRLGDGFNAPLYNLASDAIVNEVLLQGGHALPRPAVRASELIAEIGEATAAPQHVLAEWDTDRLYLALTGQDGRARRAAEDYAQARQFKRDLDVVDPQGDGHDQWTARLEQAFDAGRAAGTGVGPILARFADLPEVRVPWERHLRRLLAKAVSDVPRLSHKRPSGRWAARDGLARSMGGPSPVFEPGAARDRRRPRIVVGLDTSSSITPLQIDLFAAEVLSISRRSGAEVQLLGFDTEVHAECRIEAADALQRLELRQGGGTEFGPMLVRAEELAPAILVVMTDLDARLPPLPRFPVIWAVPKRPAAQPQYGTVLEMDR